ncbi:hypothetical protein FOZ62_008820, partial [Perkinsus olseni]
RPYSVPMNFCDIEAAAPQGSQLTQQAVHSDCDDDGRSLMEFIVPDTSQLSTYSTQEREGGREVSVTPPRSVGTRDPAKKSPDYSRFYLITWSRPRDSSSGLRAPGDISKEGFGKELEHAFSHYDIPLSFYCIVAELHDDRVSVHYHASTASPRRHRWRRLAALLLKRGIALHFKAFLSYLACYRYATKFDASPLLSSSHPALPSDPTERECRLVEQRDCSGEGTRIRKLSDIAGWITAKKLKTEVQFLAEATKEKNVKDFVLNSRDSPSVMLGKVWSMNSAANNVDRAAKGRLQILRESAEAGGCTCGGVASQAIQHILSRNSVPFTSFSESVIGMLRGGRSRNRNLAISGPSACGKSYLMGHLGEIYESLGALGSGSYPLAILLEKNVEIFILDDFRYNGKQVGFGVSDCLCFFEGKTLLTVALPKTVSKSDGVYVNDAPVTI